MPKAEKQAKTSPTGESESDRYVREHPSLVPDTDPDLAEGESELIFIAPPPDGDE